MLLAAVFQLVRVPHALYVCVALALTTLVLSGYLAVRRLPLTWWQRALILGMEGALGGFVVILELLAHHGG
ncbi:hypothetical protein [Corynebacterium heidelbergense]|uniref:hypothetical protein n=1 Tax=Corynebacterium heidelbergense TaxID=2055947 RepID=UPI001057B66A|nr:hypothetical protein [Corynebacterium heidelbergense]